MNMEQRPILPISPSDMMEAGITLKPVWQRIWAHCLLF